MLPRGTAEPLTPLEQLRSAASASEGNSTAAPHCFVLRGAWERNTRYQLRFTVVNPTHPESSRPAARVWTTPLNLAPGGTDGTSSDERHVISGPGTLGTFCEPVAHRAASMATTYDACAAAEAAGVLPEGEPVPEDCISAIQTARAASNAAVAAAGGVLPEALLALPPITSFAAARGATALECAPGEVHSTRAGGQCIRCTWGALVLGQDGAFLPSYQQHHT